MNDITNAALLFRTPDEFEILLAALEESRAETMRGKLDDALKSVAKASYHSGLQTQDQSDKGGMRE